MVNALDIQLLADAYKRTMQKNTNFDRIKAMDKKEFIAFLKTCNFDGFFPVIEGNRFYTEEELAKWFDQPPREDVVYEVR